MALSPAATGRHASFEAFGQPALEAEVDFIVVGSGAGGAAAAVILARGGHRVAVIEAGPWRAPIDYPSTTYGAMRDLFADWGSLVTQSRAFWPVVQASCVGGTTVINSAIVVRTPGDCFDRWEREYGIEARSLEKRVWEHQDRLERELAASVVGPDARGLSNTLAMDAAESLGWDSHYMTRYVRDCEGTGQCLQGCRKERKQSTNVNYIPEVLERGGYVLSCAPVDRVVLEQRRAVGVTGASVIRRRAARDRASPCARARASSSPPRPRRARSCSRGAVSRARRWGRSSALTRDWHLRRLPRCRRSERRRDAGLGLHGVSRRSRPQARDAGHPARDGRRPPPGGGRELIRRFREYRNIAMWVAAVRAESAGTVKPSLFGGPVIRYHLDEPDMRRLRTGLAMVARMHFAAGAKEIIPGIYGLPYKLGPDEVHRIEEGPLDPRCYIAVLSHLFGGCPMSADPRQGVVDGNGKVHGAEGLYVVDASAIPTTIGVNPQHTIMALASVWAENLVS